MTESRTDLPARVAEAARQYREHPSLSAETVKVHHALAVALRDYVGAVPERLEVVEDTAGEDVLGWLIGLPFELARHGLVDEAVALGARWAEVMEAENVLGDRPVILAEADRREEAITQVQDNRKRWPTDPWILIKGGDVYARLGDTSMAMTLYRHGLESAGDDQYTRDGALERLVPLLDELGRSAEADALEAAENQRENAARIVAQAEAAGADQVPFVRTVPKVGRNDPCPCGSEKKYKKCCVDRFTTLSGTDAGEEREWSH